MLDELLGRLDKVKLVGTNKWTACCPVHQDKHPSMSITEKDGKILCYCFACGAKGDDVAQAVGVSVTSLFSDPLSPRTRMLKSRESLLAEKEQDELFLRLYRKAESEGREILYSDRKRYKQAINRIAGIEQKLAQMC